MGSLPTACLCGNCSTVTGFSANEFALGQRLAPGGRLIRGSQTASPSQGQPLEFRSRLRRPRTGKEASHVVTWAPRGLESPRTKRQTFSCQSAGTFERSAHSGRNPGGLAVLLPLPARAGRRLHACSSGTWHALHGMPVRHRPKQRFWHGSRCCASCGASVDAGHALAPPLAKIERKSASLTPIFTVLPADILRNT